LTSPYKELLSQQQLTMPNQPKLNLTYPSITATKEHLKINPDVSVDQVKGYDRKARGSPFIMEHVQIIEKLTNELVEKGMENYRLTEELNEWKTEIQPTFTELRKPSEIGSMIDDMYENIKELKEENQVLSDGAEEDERANAELKEENEKLKDTFTHGNIHEIAEKHEKLKERLLELNDLNTETHQKYGIMVKNLQEQLKKGGKAHKKDKKAYDKNLKIRDEEIDSVKDEMATMYHIVMNDGDKYEISKDQPLLNMVQFNIGLMLEKLKEMGSFISDQTDDVVLHQKDIERRKKDLKKLIDWLTSEHGITIPGACFFHDP